jgi:hypothetical protein
MLANDARACRRVTSSETPAIGRLGAVTGHCLLDLMHSDFLAHIELFSSAYARPMQKHTLVAFSGSCSICSMQVKRPIDAHGRAERPGCRDR